MGWATCNGMGPWEVKWRAKMNILARSLSRATLIVLNKRVRIVGDKRSMKAGIWAQFCISQGAESVERLFLSEEEITSCITTFWNDFDALRKRDHQPWKIVCLPRFVISFSC